MTTNMHSVAVRDHTGAQIGQAYSSDLDVLGDTVRAAVNLWLANLRPDLLVDPPRMPYQLMVEIR